MKIEPITLSTEVTCASCGRELQRKSEQITDSDQLEPTIQRFKIEPCPGCGSEIFSARIRGSTAPDLEASAQKAYAAYGATTGGKNYQGLPMPAWGELPEKIRDAWRAAAEALLG